MSQLLFSWALLACSKTVDVWQNEDGLTAIGEMNIHPYITEVVLSKLCV